MTESLSVIFGCIKLHKKGSRNIYFFYLRNLSRLTGQFCSTALVQSNIFIYKVSITNAVLQNLPLNIKKYISRSLFYAILCVILLLVIVIQDVPKKETIDSRCQSYNFFFIT